jgi:hypothetical protein
MRRRNLCLAALVLAAMIAAALPGPDKRRPLVLDWCARSVLPELPPVAVLVEMGLKDTEPTVWSGRFSLSKARLLRREGYRFRSGDHARERDAWDASSHRPAGLPPRRPDLKLREPVDSVGVIFHIADIFPGAELTLSPRRPDVQPVTVSLDEVLAGRPQTIWDGNAVVRRVTATVAVTGSNTDDDFPAAAYGPDGTIWLAYIAYALKDENRRTEAQPLTQPAGGLQGIFPAGVQRPAHRPLLPRQALGPAAGGDEVLPRGPPGLRRRRRA